MTDKFPLIERLGLMKHNFPQGIFVYAEDLEKKLKENEEPKITVTHYPVSETRVKWERRIRVEEMVKALVHAVRPALSNESLVEIAIKLIDLIDERMKR